MQSYDYWGTLGIKDEKIERLLCYDGPNHACLFIDSILATKLSRPWSFMLTLQICVNIRNQVLKPWA